MVCRTRLLPGGYRNVHVGSTPTVGAICLIFYGMRMGHGRRAGHRVRQMMKKMARKRQKSELRKELSVYR